MVYCEKSNLGGSTPLTFDQHETVLALEPLIEPWILQPYFVLNLLNICCICQTCVSILCWDLNPIWLWAMSYIYIYIWRVPNSQTHTHTQITSLIPKPSWKDQQTAMSPRHGVVVVPECQVTWGLEQLTVLVGKKVMFYFISWANDGNQDVNKPRTSGALTW